MSGLYKVISVSNSLNFKLVLNESDIHLLETNRFDSIRDKPVQKGRGLNRLKEVTMKDGRDYLVQFIKLNWDPSEKFIPKKELIEQLISRFSNKSMSNDLNVAKQQFLSLDFRSDLNLKSLQYFFKTHDIHSVLISTNETPFFMMNRFNEKELDRYKLPFNRDESVTLGVGNSGRIRLLLNLETGEIHTVKKVEGRRDFKTGKAIAYDPIVVAAAKDEALFHMSISKTELTRTLKVEGAGERVGKNSTKSYMIMPYFPSKDGVDVCNAIGSISLNGVISYEEVRYLHRYLARELILGVKELHDKGVSHCDIKLENTLISKSGDFKFIDLGTATRKKRRKDVVGPIDLMAPEIVAPGIFGYKRAYNTKKADLYALGRTIQTIVEPNIKRPEVGFFRTTQEPVSIRSEPELSDLINKLIRVNPKRRLSLDEALVHPYFKNNEKLYLNKVAAIMRKMYPVESNR